MCFSLWQCSFYADLSDIATSDHQGLHSMLHANWLGAFVERSVDNTARCFQRLNKKVAEWVSRRMKYARQRATWCDSHTLFTAVHSILVNRQLRLHAHTHGGNDDGYITIISCHLNYNRVRRLVRTTKKTFWAFLQGLRMQRLQQLYFFSADNPINNSTWNRAALRIDIFVFSTLRSTSSEHASL